MTNNLISVKMEEENIAKVVDHYKELPTKNYQLDGMSLVSTI